VVILAPANPRLSSNFDAVWAFKKLLAISVFAQDRDNKIILSTDGIQHGRSGALNQVTRNINSITTSG